MTGLVLGFLCLFLAVYFGSRSSTKPVVLWIGGVGTGLSVAMAWGFTQWVAHNSFEPLQIQGLTFSGPSAEWLMRVLQSPAPKIGFEFGLLPGVFLGSFIGALVATCLLSLIAPGYWLWPSDFIDWCAFFTMGAIGAYGHHLMVKAYAAAPVSTLAPYSYSQALSALLMGWLVFDHFPDRWSLIGMALIVATGVVNAVFSHRASRRLV
ncbi:MAG: hypothetical protein EBV92_10310 [Betaproteobacteria bacterium]|nr:hypothetical protein [Betaproteobacteria bacterium]